MFWNRDSRSSFENDVRVKSSESQISAPTHIGGLLRDDKYTVRMQEAKDQWFSVTYKEGKESVVQSSKKLIGDGVYRKELYSDLEIRDAGIVCE